MTDKYPKEQTEEEKILSSLRILSAVGIIVGSWSLIFEIYFFQEFILGIYFARIAFTFIALFIFVLSYRPVSKKISTLLTHIFLISLISSFVITIHEIPRTIYINSQILSLLIFTTAIIFSWETRNQIIAAIYYNLLFAASIIFNDSNIYLLPNLLSLVLFVSLISFLSVAVSFINYNLRNKLLQASKYREDAINLLLKETLEKERIAQIALIEKKHKIELLAKINHEVRTPLNSILMYFEMLDDGSLRSLDEIKKYSSTVKISAQRLLNTINNFIDYAKIETGKLEVENELFNLDEEVEDAVHLLTPLAIGKNNEIVLINNNRSKILVYTDAIKYRQILVNLVANALKFSSNDKIRVTFENNHREEDLFEITTSIEDSGPGIPEEKLKGIFDPFVSMNEGDKVTFSSGLGLSICKDFINMLNGEIKVESTIGKGTKFIFKIPYRYNYEKFTAYPKPIQTGIV
ncbi:MAG: HAMP domain-containing sensor histidine kinase [Ignavibacteriaceae bacterium]|nr:HAMP domain-containing sensor histidine kinase [Ignavibacteriaceae bacterium]